MKVKRMRLGAAAIGAAALLVAGCGVQAGSPNTRNATGGAGLNAMGNMPGMNRVGMNSTASTSSPNTPAIPVKVIRHGRDVEIQMTAQDTVVHPASGVNFNAWTFDGTLPGPVLYVQQADHVTLTLHNLDSAMPHSIDLHAATDAPAGTWTEVAPGQTGVVHFTAAKPGVYLYHCATEPMLVHMARGMYGAIVVLASGEAKPDAVIVQSELYPGNDTNAMLNDQPQYVVFDGEVNRYVDHPLRAKVGQPFRISFVNAGPNEFSAFHIVGTVLADVQPSGSPEDHLRDVQTYTVAPGDGALITVVFHKAGTYTFVSHSMAQMEKGAMGKIVVSP